MRPPRAVASRRASRLTAPPPPIDPVKKQQQKTTEKHYQAAIDGYTRAIELGGSLSPPSSPPAPSSVAALFGNRAFAHIRLEEYGSAIADATDAIALDPAYVKAYYRRGDANFALGKFKEALRDLRAAAKVAPRDPDLRRKLAECERAVKRIRFEEALATPEGEVAHASDSVDLGSMAVEDAYDGPRMDEVTAEEALAAHGTAGAAAVATAQPAGSPPLPADAKVCVVTRPFVEAMIERFKAQKLVHRKYALALVLAARHLLKQLPSLVDVPVAPRTHITVCGDVHGQFFDLLNIFALNGPPAEDNPYLFNGDFVDRGSWSVEVALTLFAYKALGPGSLHLTRGNHEAHSMNKLYGFDGEVRAKYGGSGVLLDCFREAFNWLPLGYVLGGKVLVVHGGLFSRDGVTLDDLRNVDRNREPPDEGLMCEALWSDPAPGRGRMPSKRGVGLQFGEDVTAAFLEANGLELVVRSHEVKEEGYEVAHGGKLVTVFSAPNYCDAMGNRGAFIRFNGDDMVPHFTTFEAAPHPDVKPMAYASSFLSQF